jgi:opacity protein-like surface antigen
MKGVISGKTNSGNLMLVLRKGIFTNFSRYGIDIIDLSMNGSVNLRYSSKSIFFTNYTDIDINKQFFIQGGYIWERDIALRLKDRHTIYGGVGFNSSLFRKLKIKSLIASGRIDQDYTVPVDNIDVIKKPYAALYSVLDLDYTITNTWSFTSKVYYFTNLNDWNRYRYGYYLNLKVRVWKNISLAGGYNYKYDKELTLLGLIPDNSTQTLGIEISL